MSPNLLKWVILNRSNVCVCVCVCVCTHVCVCVCVHACVCVCVSCIRNNLQHTELLWSWIYLSWETDIYVCIMHCESDHHFTSLHLSLKLNCMGRLGTTDDFTTNFLHFSLFSTALCDLANSRPFHSLMLSSHLFLCLPYLLPPFCALQDGFGQT